MLRFLLPAYPYCTAAQHLPYLYVGGGVVGVVTVQCIIGDGAGWSVQDRKCLAILSAVVNVLSHRAHVE